MTFGKLNVDLGVRLEGHSGNFVVEKTTTAANADGRNVAWGNGSFDRFNLSANDWSVALGASYQVKKTLNVYGNFSRGYFFPEYRGYNVKYKAGVPIYPVEKPEHILQGELGLKYGGKKLTATVAGYSISLKDRYAVNLVTINSVLRETQSLQSSTAYGLEFTYDWQFAKSFHFTGMGTLQKATYSQFVDSSTATPIDNKGKWLERQPRLMYSPSLAYENKKFYAAFSLDYVGKRFGNAANLVELDPYTLARLDLAYSFTMKNEERLRISAGIFNLFNSTAVTEGNPRAGNAQTNTGDFFVGRVSLPRSFYMRMALSF
jgi:outer membrane receptor protein involved in Fe transport